MSDYYTKTEVDLKFDGVEKNTRLLFQKILSEFEKVDKDIQWIMWISISFIAGNFILRLFGK